MVTVGATREAGGSDSLSLTDVVVRRQDVFGADVDGEVVILDVERGQYCGLKNVGARIWGLLENEIAVADIRDTLLGIYDVDADRCEKELLAVLKQMRERQLIVVRRTSKA